MFLVRSLARIEKLVCSRSLCCVQYQLPTSSTARFLHSTRTVYDKNPSQKAPEDQKWKMFRMTMSEEQKVAKTAKIEQMRAEEAPKTLFAKVKYYFKRYWYIAVPAHAASCTAWFIALYLVVKSGVDVIALLEWMHMPDAIVEKVKNTPETAGVVVVSLILYKIAMPFRYMTTLLLIQATFWTLRRMGKLKTAREVEYKVRHEYELNKAMFGRKWYRYRHLGVRSVSRKNSVHATTAHLGQVQRLQKEHDKLNEPKHNKSDQQKKDD
ncbi:hypothetical protein CAEBREN_25315 [Caenorhabditis brenneri]|uniref:DUF1279 domain-containing protein n=1 Tax=Caenorhabditis brenneri TaxID=135651 RepID=G0NRK7_CAEBE|nr:hypothetical protein CAEBREN_25315 [Caenorhabditis brenneri]